jgi:hypothetical protein
MFFNGIPTGTDVRRLRAAFPDETLKPGTIIPHSEVATVINTPVGSPRYLTITNIWRKIVESETDKIIGVERGQGFKVLSEGEKVFLSGNKLRSSGRMARRAFVIAGRVDLKQLSDQERVEYDHSTKRAVAIMQAAKLKGTPVLPIIE